MLAKPFDEALIYGGVLSAVTAALMLLLAGFTKVMRPDPFVRALRAYRVVPESFLPLVAITVPVLEIAIGVGLCVRIHSVCTAGASALLLGTFSVAMAINLMRGRNLDCGCGLIKSRQISWLLILRNCGLAAMSFGAIPSYHSAAIYGVACWIIGETVSPSLARAFTGNLQRAQKI